MKKTKAAALKIVLVVIALILTLLSAGLTCAILTEKINYNAMKRFFGAEYVGNTWIRLFFVLSCFLAAALIVYAVALICSYYIDRNAKFKKMADKKESVRRFAGLDSIDKAMANYKTPQYDDSISLAELCERFRYFCASKFGLYYDELTVRSFISSLLITKLIIMQGISGTGKTSLAWAFGEFTGKSSTIIPVQPSWKEKTDLLGYFNEFTDHFNETEFLRKLYEALYTDNVNVIVLDEMNIARVEYYFAEFLSLLEMKQTDRRIISLASGGWLTDPEKIVDGRITLPENMWYIGTANNDDSTMAISDKVYDRAMVLDLDRRADPFEAPETEGVRISFTHMKELGEEAQKQYKISDGAVENINKLDKFLSDNLGVSFGNRTMRQIESFVPVYLSAGGTEDEAIDIIVARKVLRKLESKNPMIVKKYVNDFCGLIDDIYGSDKLPLCRRVIEKYNF